MDSSIEKKSHDAQYQRDGAVDGADVGNFRDDQREYSRGGRGGRRGGAHQSANWRSDPSGGGGSYRGGGSRGSYRGGGRGRGGSSNAWADHDDEEAPPTRSNDAAPPSAPAVAPGASAPAKAPPSARVEESGDAAPGQGSREAVADRWTRNDDRGYGGGRGGRGGFRGGSRGDYGGRGGRRFYDPEEGSYRRRGDDAEGDQGDEEEGGYSRNQEGGYRRGGWGGGRGGRGGYRRYYDDEGDNGDRGARGGEGEEGNREEGGYSRNQEGGYRRGGWGGGRGGRGGYRRYYDDEGDNGDRGARGGEGEEGNREEGGYGGGYRRGGGRGGYGRDYDNDYDRSRGRGGRRDFRSFRNEDDAAQESAPVARDNAWASSPAPTVEVKPLEVRTAPREDAPAPFLRPPLPRTNDNGATAPVAVTVGVAPSQPLQPMIRRTVRAPHLRKNCHDDARVMELFQHHHRQTGISLDNYDSIPVEMVPRDVKPVEDFADLLVEPALAANIERCGYKRPTPVQRYGIPVALSGSDLMACAQTGSGKTAAFLIPVVQYLLVHGVSPARQRKSYPIALVLAPTRELAVQIFDEVRKLTYDTDIFYDVVYGGTRYPQRFEQDILVACPGRLRDMFSEEYLSFSAIKFLILDEADRMLEMGFEEQIEELVASRYTDMPTAEERQTFMFSATFPQRILNLAKRYLRRKYYLLTVGRVGSTTKNITQTIENVPDNEKMDRLLQIIYGHDRNDMVLVFVETKKMAEDVNHRLNREGISSTTIHGDRRQQDREAALEDFKQKLTPILVATDVASRGLDIPDVAHVVQFDLPQELDDYTHRIGRTGRAGNKGIATAFYNRNNRRLAIDLHRYFSEHGQEIPKWFQQEAELVEGEALLSRDIGGGGGGGGRRRGGGGGGGGGGHRSGGGRGGGGAWGDTRSSAPSAGSRRAGALDDGGF